MMQTITKSLNASQLALAQYYLTKLRKLEASYNQGYEHSEAALALFDKEWPQIKHWHNWLASQAGGDDEIAQLYATFSESGIELLRLRQHPHERLEWLETGLAAAQQVQDERSEMQHFYMLARLHNSLTSLTLSQEYAEKALKLADKGKDFLFKSKILSTISNTFYKSGDYELSRAHAAQALKLAKALDASQEMGVALNALANTELSQSDYQSAYVHYLEYLKISELLGRPHDICLAFHNLSNVTEILGMKDDARRYAEACVELARQTGNDFQLATSLGMLGFLASEQGQIMEAQAYLQESLELSQQLGLPDEALHAWGRLGNLRLLTEDYTGALDAYEHALALSNQSGFRHFGALALACIVQANRLLGQHEPALKNLRLGLELVATMKMQSIQILYLHETAQLWHELGRSEEAAQFIGILEDNTHEFDKKDLEDFASLVQRLETRLGSNTLAQAKMLGKTAKLEELLSEIYKTIAES